jgi:hypothetical protein
MKPAPLLLLAVLLHFACGTARHTPDTLPESPCPLAFDTTHTHRFRLTLRAGAHTTTGLFLLKHNGTEWRGSLIAEAGSLKLFDLIAPPGKCRLANPIEFLDKWYIRRTLASDFAFLLWPKAKRRPPRSKRLRCFPDGTFQLTNTRRNIEYTFQPL